MAERASITLSAETADFFRRLKELAGKEVIYQRIQRFFHREGGIVGGKIAKSIGSGESGLRRRTGALARSIVGLGIRIDGVPAIQVGALRGPAIKYVAVQEYGTKGADPSSPIPTIRPKRAKNLAIPVNDTLTPAGVPRYPGPRRDPRRLFFIPFRKRGSNVTGALYPEGEYRKILAHQIITSGSNLVEGLDLKVAREVQKKHRQTAAGDFSKFKAAWLLVKQMDVKPKRFLRGGFFGALPGIVDRLGKLIKGMFLKGGGGQ